MNVTADDIGMLYITILPLVDI